MNLEIIRRNLRFGITYGLLFGLGICLADLTYLTLLATGAISILKHPTILKVISIIGAAVLAWFGISALRLRSNEIHTHTTKLSLWQQTMHGYFMTLTSPFTILFWASVSTQLATLTHKSNTSVWFIGSGVLFGVLSWMIGLNFVLHLTRHKLSNRTMQLLNYIGGIILIGFALVGLWMAIR
jgi:threonine/homoserine/homoserine lactone efflux protein